MSTLHPGTRINNYLLVEQIGSGSFGVVWSARHHVFDDLVAIKIPTDPEYVRQLRREGVVIHGLRHPNIVRALDMDPFADTPYLIMEHVPGPSLRRVIEHYAASISAHAAVTILRGVLCGLSAAHAREVVHRDLKPENILLVRPIEQLASITEHDVKVTDFGLGRAGLLSTSSMLQSASLQGADARGLSGTLAYMSPEQREGREVDARTDLYACGIVLFEMLTGERPQGTETPSMLRPGLPPVLDDVFRRAYTRLDRRYASAIQMYEALAAVGIGRPGGAHSARNPQTSRAERLPAARDAASLEHEAFTSEGAARGVSCPRCVGAVEMEDQFCIHCGAALTVVVPRCEDCGGYVRTSDRYCIYCGEPLEWMV